MTFNAIDKLSKYQGKDYLEVKWRLVWFREDHPKGQITTEVIHFDEQRAAVRAVVMSEDGQVLGTGMAACEKQVAPHGRYLEKAETSGIGRALAVAGYGTQFAGEDVEEGDHLSDAPIGGTNTIMRPDSVDVDKRADEVIALYGERIMSTLTSDEITAVKDAALIKSGATLQVVHDRALHWFGNVNAKKLAVSANDFINTLCTPVEVE